MGAGEGARARAGGHEVTPHRLALGAVLAVLAVSLCARAEASPPVLSGVDVKKVNGNAVSGSALPVDGSAHTQPVSAVSLPLPTGAATAAKQDTANTSLAAIADALAGTIAVSGALSVAGGLTNTELRASAVPVSLASLPLPSGAATSAKQAALGTAGTPSSDVLTVQGATSMTALKVDGSAVTQPVSGTFWQATQPVSAAALPLPSGAATASNQTTANTSLASIDGKLPALSGGRVPVDTGSISVGTVTTITNAVTTKPASTTISTSPAQVSVGTTATRVFAANAAICLITVVNQGTNPVTCGQDNTVTDLGAGLSLNPIPAGSNAVVGNAISFGAGGFGYGGDVYCIAHTSATNVGVQATHCP
jgi:hypothetical protein